MRLRPATTVVSVATVCLLAGRAFAATFEGDADFLRQHVEMVDLHEPGGSGRVLVSPALQGRVLTSGSDDSRPSHGWINRAFMSSDQRAEHMHVYGGEDRIWLGPEGGQFGLYFTRGAPFDLAHWYVPAPFDTQPFKVDKRTSDSVQMSAAFELVNYSGTHFQAQLKRTVKVLSAAQAWQRLGLSPIDHIALVAYESDNVLFNTGPAVWVPETGLLSIWVLGMYPPSKHATIAVPLRPVRSGAPPGVKFDYFGPVPPQRFRLGTHAAFLSADGQFRSKIGIQPQRALGRVLSYDADQHTLTLVESDTPPAAAKYVNSDWEIQKNPYGGDPINAYNDGPASTGAQQLGPFFELETSSPAAALAPGAHTEHVHRTMHLIGSEDALDVVVRRWAGVSLAEIRAAVHPG